GENSIPKVSPWAITFCPVGAVAHIKRQLICPAIPDILSVYRQDGIMIIEAIALMKFHAIAVDNRPELAL
ncbi:MAG: hypothetical protein KAT71_05365, partial [Gammaproteobacteria bacterium]|nr:hypothetical protein [Gammaproteobacteria bacterium]